MCVAALGIMGILAQQYFNTRGSLNYYLVQMTFELHRHNGVDEEDVQARASKDTRQKTDNSAKFFLKGLPVGTSIIREQTEHTVQQTTIDSSGKKRVGPEEVTMSRSYILDMPGVDRVTGIRRWRKSPQQVGTPSTSTNPSIETKPTGKAIEAASDLTLTKRSFQAHISTSTNIKLTYILDMPGVDRVTGIRRWRKSPQQVGTPSTSTNPSIETKPTGKAIEAASDLTLTKRNPAGKDFDSETSTTNISRVTY
ncbi:unnamed protein product [Angiostrongylus costaricensis]|uniref:SHSP domain-containing protein n=1 Tax=Angiostrongylus costaricensis TaxID=334426 RepID=A0A0R3PD37_ANGCS|nr:unnamed protein product [Angiostrongylus costaricensis]